VLQFEIPILGVSLIQVLDSFGQVPLPPIQIPRRIVTVSDGLRLGAIAAPTAGLHFTPQLLSQLQERGIGSAFVTLHVGVGTFRPVQVEDVTTHKMGVGRGFGRNGGAIHQTQGEVGLLRWEQRYELWKGQLNGQLQPFCGKTNLFIYPGYQWRVVEGLITNFHLPDRVC